MRADQPPALALAVFFAPCVACWCGRDRSHVSV